MPEQTEPPHDYKCRTAATRLARLRALPRAHGRARVIERLRATPPPPVNLFVGAGLLPGEGWWLRSCWSRLPIK